MATLTVIQDGQPTTYNLIGAYTAIANSTALDLILQAVPEDLIYHITTDDVYKDIAKIQSLIQQKISNAMSNVHPLVITEDPLRLYLVFGDIDVEEMFRFNGKRV